METKISNQARNIDSYLILSTTSSPFANCSFFFFPILTLNSLRNFCPKFSPIVVGFGFLCNLFPYIYGAERCPFPQPELQNQQKLPKRENGKQNNVRSPKCNQSSILLVHHLHEFDPGDVCQRQAQVDHVCGSPFNFDPLRTIR